MIPRLATFLLLLASLSARVVLSETVVDVAAAIATAEKALLESQVVLSSLDNLTDNVSKVILSETAALEKSFGELDAQTKEVELLVRDVNAKQLKVIVSKLEEIRDKEGKRRNREDVINGEGVTLSELKELFKPETILAESEAKVEEWVLGILEEEMLVLQKEWGAALAPDAPDNCVTPEQALNVVQEALLNHSRDVIGILDHANGATILHEFTSQTYTPPPEPSQLLGSVWWRKYIPEDWELMLPEGWEDWNVGLPQSILHTVGKGGAAAAPPETILHPNVLPGSCWPMQGRRGKVMVSLPYPVQVTAITLDHVSHHLLMDKEEQLKSAPKNVRVFGYPPCRGDCDGLTFDSTKKHLLGEIEYDIEKPSIQTFPVEDGGEAIAAGSCSVEVEAPACDGGLGLQDEETEGLYSAIQLEVVNNWGNEAYTCLYRVRVHGEPEI
jgi:hypothetical protein